MNKARAKKVIYTLTKERLFTYKDLDEKWCEGYFKGAALIANHLCDQMIITCEMRDSLIAQVRQGIEEGPKAIYRCL